MLRQLAILIYVRCCGAITNVLILIWGEIGFYWPIRQIP